MTLLLASAIKQRAFLPNVGTAKIAHLLPHFLLCHACFQILLPRPDAIGAVIQFEHAGMVEVDYLNLCVHDLVHRVHHSLRVIINNRRVSSS